MVRICSKTYLLYIVCLKTLTIFLQDKLPIILTATMTPETNIKGYHIYKVIWTPEQGEYLDVSCGPENVVDICSVFQMSWTYVVYFKCMDICSVFQVYGHM